MRNRKLRIGTVVLAACYVASGLTAIADDRMNIVFFLSDDQRFDAMGCAGHPVIKTPTIDKLAQQGVLFKNAFVTTSICAASRASIFTGLVIISPAQPFQTRPGQDYFRHIQDYVLWIQDCFEQIPNYFLQIHIRCVFCGCPGQIHLLRIHKHFADP